MDPGDLTYIRVVCSVPDEFNLELSCLDAGMNNPPPDPFEVYKETFEAGLRFSIPPFIYELRFYDVSLCTLILNFLRLVLEFLVICFLVEVHPSISLFHAFFTAKNILKPRISTILINHIFIYLF